MFISQLFLNNNSLEVKRDLGDCQELHRTLSKAFLDNRADSGWLYEFKNEEKQNLINVRSSCIPNWAILPKGYLLKIVGPKFSTKYLSLQNNQILFFRLKANPTRRLLETGDRVLINQPLKQTEWLLKKGKNNGFELLSSKIILNDKISGFRNRQKITFGSVVFNGYLKISDKDRFIQCLKNGIGSAKAYGFGMLILEGEF